jgi:hypothetical protein
MQKLFIYNAGYPSVKELARKYGVPRKRVAAIVATIHGIQNARPATLGPKKRKPKKTQNRPTT